MITPAFSLTATERVLPKLALDFTTASLDSRVTFTRAGNTATVVNSSGVLVAVNADTPRFDYTLNTGGVCRGLLIEEARTNVAFNSSNVLSGNWLQSLYNGGAQNFYTVTSVSTPSPGPGNANYFIATATPGNISARQTGVSLASGTTQTVSAYVYVPSQAGLSSWRFDVNYQGDYGAGTTSTVFNQWVRVANTTTLTGLRTTVDFNVLQGNGAPVISGTQFYMTNMQIEQGAFVTSYIPTTTATVTRNADVATMTGTNFSNWFNATEGTLVTWFNIPIDYSTGFPTFSCISDGTTTNRIVLTSNSGGNNLNLEMFASGSLQAGFYPSYTSENTKVGFAYKLNNTNFGKDGTNGTTDTTCSVPTCDRLNIGSNQSSSNFLNGYVQKFFYYPQRLINAELAAFSK